MDRKVAVIVVVALLIGWGIGKLIFNQYEITDVFAENSDQKLYFFQAGVFSSMDSVKENFKEDYEYVAIEENDKYHVYIAITSDNKVRNIIEKYFNDMNTNVYVKEINNSNLTFIETLKQNDQNIKEITKSEEIYNMIKQSIIKYKELVLNNEYSN